MFAFGVLLAAGASKPHGPAELEGGEGADPGIPQKTCLTSECHTEYRELRFTHGPVALGKCLSCHEYEEDATPYESGEDHWFDVVDRDGRLCLRCHESRETEAFVHYPMRRLQCLACHDPHGSDHPGMMRHGEVAENCYECHERKMDDDSLVHAPVRVGACTLCHDPHGSPNPLALVVRGSALCLRCHTDIGDRLAADRHAHRPVIENCALCHQPHDSDHPALLRDTVPGLCLGCHEEMSKHLDEVGVEHGALDTEASCLKCHDPHSSNFSRQLVASPIDLCLTCHDQPLVGKDHVIRDMKSFLAENPDHHGPIRSGDCAACHNPHGSDFVALVFQAYPKSFYSPFDLDTYSLCFGCHEQSLVLDPETETLTSFRNGSTNLHYTHVHREKGRTCRACHDVHASHHPKHIADSVPFGVWSLPIGYEVLTDGGRCSPGCHETRSYDRNAILPVEGPRNE